MNLGYLIALIDEIFGRRNRISVITFKQSSASGPKAINPGLVTTNNFILYYAKNKGAWSPSKVFVPTARDERYTKYIENSHAAYTEWRMIQLKDAFLKKYRIATWNEAKVRFLDRLEEKVNEFVLNNAASVVRTARVAPKDINESARSALKLSSMNPREGIYERAEKIRRITIS